ncbi:MAG: pyridoxal phosphate-dependent aminotransferase [Desulfuromonadales bacterium]|nr:pyridoxal phosphate-dependent aminotransferase [Desulfuromonadales bacterium]
MAIAMKIAGHISRSSWIRKMFEEGERLRQEYGADKIYDFTLGNPDVEPPEAFQRELLELAMNPLPGMHRYMNNAGYTETRAAVAAKLSKDSGLDVTAGHIIMTCGAGGALNVVLKTILNPGEEVIILAPFFVEYKFYIDNHGGVPVEVWTNHETFQLDIDAIAKAINSRTRAILICSPNNPTGVIYPEESLRQLGDVLKKIHKDNGHLIYAISDEPYARIAFDGKHVPNIFPLVESSIIVTSHSKDLALPGERIGYLAANPRMDTAMQFMEGAVFSNRVLGFVNAPALMQRLVAKLQDESVDINEYQAKRDLLVTELTGMGFSMVRPDGAFYLFPKSPLADDVEFVKLAQKHHILLVPGAGFGAPGFFRIAYCVDKGMIEQSLPAWRNLAKEAGLKG